VADADFLVEQIKNVRIFEDQEGKMNLSLPGYRRRGFGYRAIHSLCRLEKG
jgi:hypothetical protein